MEVMEPLRQKVIRHSQLNSQEQHSTTASADKEVKFEGVLGTLSQNGQTLRECGLFNAGAGGTLFARNTFTDLAKTSSIELQIFITVRVEN